MGVLMELMTWIGPVTPPYQHTNLFNKALHPMLFMQKNNHTEKIKKGEFKNN